MLKKPYDHPVRIIAEIGCNHGGSSDQAIYLGAKAINCGAHYIKYQMFDPYLLALSRQQPELEKILNPYTFIDSQWKQILSTIPKRHQLVTVFDSSSAMRAVMFGVPKLKLSHKEYNKNLPLTELCQYLSVLNLVGSVSSESQIPQPSAYLRQPGIHDDELMFTISKYPTSLPVAMKVIEYCAPLGIGYSDHTGNTLEAAKYAIDGGCKLIEIHVHDDGCAGCCDHAVSKSMTQLKELCDYAISFRGKP